MQALVESDGDGPVARALIVVGGMLRGVTEDIHGGTLDGGGVTLPNGLCAILAVVFGEGIQVCPTGTDTRGARENIVHLPIPGDGLL